MSLRTYLESIQSVQGAVQVVGTPRYVTIGDLTAKGSADVDARPKGQPKLTSDKQKLARASLDEAEVSTIDMLHKALNDEAGCSDDEIKAGIQLTDAGCQKLAARLGVSAAEVPALVNALIAQMQQESTRLEEAYRALVEDARFAYEGDRNGNVTVRDTESGKSIYIQGSDGADLLARLKDAPDSQPILQGVMALHDKRAQVAAWRSIDSGAADVPYRKARDLAEDAEPGGFDDEIGSDRGSYNMPWELDGQRGTMTVLFGLERGKPVLDIASVRDEHGAEFEPEAEMQRHLLSQARSFIGHE